ncbi:MAG: hypothetical protein FJ265_17635 [Planctomycetes bacterium]|nr:hypothetical protein [Planctomycetota bacterium]
MPASPAWFRGQSTTRYYARWTSDEADHDLVELLSLDFGNAARDTVSGRVMGRLTYDLDGYDTTFASINDAYGDRFDALLYDAYADLNKVPGFSRVRLGRQSVVETPEVAWFDGAHATSAEFTDFALQFGAYGGASTHLYESSRSGDLVAGAYAQGRPWTGARLRLDYMRLEDDGRFGEHDDDLLGAGFWQEVGKRLRFDAQYSRIASADRDAQGHVLYRVPEWDLWVRGGYFRLLEAQGELVLEADPFFQALNRLFPYDQWSLQAAKGFADLVRLQAAMDLRRVDDAGDVGFYNRDYDRWSATVTLLELGVKGLTASGTVDLWDTDAQLVRSFGGDLGYAVDRTTLSLGTYYSLYKYDLFTNSERDHVRTYYLRLHHKLNASFGLDGDYEFEDEGQEEFHRIRLGVTWRF